MNLLNCTYKNQFDFAIDLDKKTIIWNGREGKLKQYLNALTNDVSCIVGVNGYSSYIKSHSCITPDIYYDDITSCSDRQNLKSLFNHLL